MMTTDGPLVEINNPPALTWSSDGLFTNGVDKAKVSVGTKVTFKVVYSDLESDRPAPGYPKLYIDRNGDGDFTDSLEAIEMVQETSDYLHGAAYTMDLILAKGKHSYKFEARDIKGNMGTGNPTQLQEPGVTVKAAATTQGPAMMIYIVFIILIVVIAVVAFIVGKKMGGKGPRPAKAEDASKTAAQPQAPAADQYPQQQGYAYDPNQAAYQYQYPTDQTQAQQPAPQVPQAPSHQPAPAPAPAPQPQAPAHAPAPAKPPASAHSAPQQPPKHASAPPTAPGKPVKPPELPPKI
jgi:hypothetical protein